MKPENSPYYLEYCLSCQERSFIYSYNNSLVEEMQKTKNVIKANEASIEFLNKKIQNLALQHKKHISKKPLKAPKTVISKAKKARGAAQTS